MKTEEELVAENVARRFKKYGTTTETWTKKFNNHMKNYPVFKKLINVRTRILEQ